MFLGSRSRSGKSVVMSDLSLQELSAETYTTVFEFLSSDIDKFVLFDSVATAEKVAYALRGEWDGSTGVEIPDFDPTALELAASLAGGQWCKVGDSELIAGDRLSLDSQMHVRELFPIGFRDTADFNLFALPDIGGLTFPIGRAEVYWAIADGVGSLSAANISRVTGFRKSTVQGHLSALEKAGAIRSMGRPKQYTVAEDCPQEYLSQLQSCASLVRSMRKTCR